MTDVVVVGGVPGLAGPPVGGVRLPVALGLSVLARLTAGTTVSLFFYSMYSFSTAGILGECTTYNPGLSIVLRTYGSLRVCVCVGFLGTWSRDLTTYTAAVVGDVHAMFECGVQVKVKVRPMLLLV